MTCRIMKAEKLAFRVADEVAFDPSHVRLYLDMVSKQTLSGRIILSSPVSWHQHLNVS